VKTFEQKIAKIAKNFRPESLAVFALQSVRITHIREDFFCRTQGTREKAFARRIRRSTQMKYSFAVSALIGVVCGQIRIRLRLALLRSLRTLC
jgi:hypothetical protein